MNGAAVQTLTAILGTNTGDWIGDITASTPDKSDIGGIYAGGSYSSVNFWHGTLDEVRLSNVERNDNWVTTEYNNQSSPSTFYTIASATSLVGPSKVQWLVADHLGTPRMILDQTGDLANLKRHDYLPFGEELFAPTGGRTTAMGYTSGDAVRQQFSGKERDAETGLDYSKARYYASLQGRFTSADLVFADQHEADPQSWNLYSYVSNSPTVYTDPFGRWKRVPCTNDRGSDCWQAEEGDTWASLAVDARVRGLTHPVQKGELLARYFQNVAIVGGQTTVDLSGFAEWKSTLTFAELFTGFPSVDADFSGAGGIRNITKAASKTGIFSRFAQWLGIGKRVVDARNIGGVTAEQAAKLRELLEKIPGVEEVGAFGSRTLGSFTKDSDLDIALIGNINKFNPNTLRAVNEAQEYAASIGIGLGKGYRPLDIGIYQSVREFAESFRNSSTFDASRGVPKLVTIE